MPDYKLDKVEHIDVICNTIRESKRIKYRFNSNCKEVQFCTINDLIKTLEKAACDKVLDSSDPIDQSTIKAILSLMEDRVHDKRMAIPTHLPSFLQFTTTGVLGLPAKNIDEVAPCFICPSCKLIYHQFYLLGCGHQQCEVCVSIRTNCATCKSVSCDKVFFDPNSQMKMEDVSIHCFGCEWTGSLKDYQMHFKQNHDKLLTCFIGSKEDDESTYYLDYLMANNQIILSDNHSTLDSNISIKSLNGTSIWEICHISDQKKYVTFDEQKSIYSCPFYTSPNGYKMCLRLFINGDCTTRGVHMSLYFMLMRGDHDANLRWPFRYKVTFTLIDQSATNDDKREISKYCWPNTKETCFGYPIADMNIPYGISKCFGHDLFEQNEKRYVQNDRMFIKIEVDHLSEISASSLGLGGNELQEDEKDPDTSGEHEMSMVCFRVPK